MVAEVETKDYTQIEQPHVPKGEEGDFLAQLRLKPAEPFPTLPPSLSTSSLSSFSPSSASSSLASSPESSPNTHAMLENAHEFEAEALFTPEIKRRKKLLNILQSIWDRNFELNSGGTEFRFSTVIMKELVEEKFIQEKERQEKKEVNEQYDQAHLQARVEQAYKDNNALILYLKCMDDAVYIKKMPHGCAEICSIIFRTFEGRSLDDESYKNCLLNIYQVLSQRVKETVYRDVLTARFYKEKLREVELELMAYFKIPAVKVQEELEIPNRVRLAKKVVETEKVPRPFFNRLCKTADKIKLQNPLPAINPKSQSVAKQDSQVLQPENKHSESKFDTKRMRTLLEILDAYRKHTFSFDGGGSLFTPPKHINEKISKLQATAGRCFFSNLVERSMQPKNSTLEEIHLYNDENNEVCYYINDKKIKLDFLENIPELYQLEATFSSEKRIRGYAPLLDETTGNKMRELVSAQGHIYQMKLTRSGFAVCNAISKALNENTILNEEDYKKLLIEIYEILSPKLNDSNGFIRWGARFWDTASFNRRCLAKITPDLMYLLQIDNKEKLAQAVKDNSNKKPWYRRGFSCFK